MKKYININANKPWLKNPAWADNNIKSNAGDDSIFMWMKAIIWNLLFILPEVYFFNDRPFIISDIGWEGLAVLLPFHLIGFVFLFKAYQKTRALHYFGTTNLILDPFPGSIGGDVAGTIDTNIPYSSNLYFKVTLSLIYGYIGGEGKYRGRRAKIEWKKESHAVVKLSSQGTKISFLIAVPKGLKHTQQVDDKSDYSWYLDVNADLTGINFDRSFTIPVYPTKERSRMLRNY